jgi:hypothetical protein
MQGLICRLILHSAISAVNLFVGKERINRRDRRDRRVERKSILQIHLRELSGSWLAGRRRAERMSLTATRRHGEDKGWIESTEYSSLRCAAAPLRESLFMILPLDSYDEGQR